jgi:hypothetical protein
VLQLTEVYALTRFVRATETPAKFRYALVTGAGQVPAYNARSAANGAAARRENRMASSLIRPYRSFSTSCA